MTIEFPWALWLAYPVWQSSMSSCVFFSHNHFGTNVFMCCYFIIEWFPIMFVGFTLLVSCEFILRMALEVRILECTQFFLLVAGHLLHRLKLVPVFWFLWLLISEDNQIDADWSLIGTDHYFRHSTFQKLYIFSNQIYPLQHISFFLQFTHNLEKLPTNNYFCSSCLARCAFDHDRILTLLSNSWWRNCWFNVVTVDY